MPPLPLAPWWRRRHEWRRIGCHRCWRCNLLQHHDLLLLSSDMLGRHSPNASSVLPMSSASTAARARCACRTSSSSISDIVAGGCTRRQACMRANSPVSACSIEGRPSWPRTRTRRTRAARIECMRDGTDNGPTGVKFRDPFCTRVLHPSQRPHRELVTNTRDDAQALHVTGLLHWPTIPWSMIENRLNIFLRLTSSYHLERSLPSYESLRQRRHQTAVSNRTAVSPQLSKRRQPSRPLATHMATACVSPR
jgi:hypothetical protein